MTLLALVCPNGLGHYRRVMAVLARLLELRNDVAVTVACSEAQVAAMPPPPGFRTETGITEPGVGWSDRAGTFADGRLRGWEKGLGRLDLDRFDLVLSDNLAGVLARRPDAVLEGSFLWSEVLADAYPGDPVVGDFAAWERGLLARTSPPMLCVGALATPDVFRLTRAVDVGFTAWESLEPVGTEIPEGPWPVAVLGGAGGAAGRIHARLVEGLLADPRWEIALAARDIASFGVAGRPRVTRFDFTPAAWRRCRAAVVRPGLGTVHEALAAGVPLVCSYEQPQLEMAHVAKRLGELGLARDFGASTDAAALGGVLEDLMQPGTRAAFDRARGRQRWDGVRRSAEWLADRCASVAGSRG